MAGEVVLSAGAIHSPKILMHSGIGPAEQLQQHGIAVIVDAPGVGENLHDHPMVPVRAYVKGDLGYQAAAQGSAPSRRACVTSSPRMARRRATASRRLPTGIRRTSPPSLRSNAITLRSS